MKLGENKKYFKIAVTGIAIAAGACVILFIFYRFSEFTGVFQKILSILRPFIYGAALAYILTPLCSSLTNLFSRHFAAKLKKFSQALAILICLLITITVLFLLGIIIIPQAVRSLISVVTALPGQLRSLNAEVIKVLVDYPEIQARWQNISTMINSEIEKWTTSDILPVAQSILYGTATYVTNFLVFLKDWLLGLVISVYLMATRKQLAAQGKLVLHSVFADRWARLIKTELHYVDRMFTGFLTGKILDSLIVGFSSPILISVIVGVTNIIPFFGPFIGAIPCALILFLDNPVHCLMFVIFILVLQQLDGNVIGPRVLGNTTGLSGFWVTFAILLFGGVWGITGMIVGVPLFAVIYDLIRKLCYKELNIKGKNELIQDYQTTFHPKQVEKTPQRATKKQNPQNK